MASSHIYLSNGIEVKKAPVGFSWTTFFFGGWPAIFRQDWLTGLLILIGCLLTWGLAAIVMSFIYNKMYIKSLIAKGFKVHSIAGMTENELKSELGFIELPKTEDFKG